MNSKEFVKDDSYKFKLDIPVRPSFPIHPDYTKVQTGGGNKMIDYNSPVHLPSYPTNPSFPIDPRFLKGGQFFETKQENSKNVDNNYELQDSTSIESLNNQLGGSYQLPPLPVNSNFPIDPKYLPKQFKNRLCVNTKKEYNKLPPLPVLPTFPIHKDYLQ